MNYEEKRALFLGMLSGDGCLSIKHNGEGYRIYPINFCNTEKEIVTLFDKLFFELFGIHGNIHSQKRINRKEIWHFLKYSHNIVNELKSLGFPEGVKKRSYEFLKLFLKALKRNSSFLFMGCLLLMGAYAPTE